MSSIIPSPIFTMGQQVFTIGSSQILTGELTGITYVEPTDGTNIGYINYEVTFNRETAGEVKQTHVGSAIYSSHATALTAFGARG